MADMVNDCVTRLVAYNGSLQIAHWKADTVTNEHKALGDLYDSMIDHTDKFAEVFMGKYGKTFQFPKDCRIIDLGKTPCGYGMKLVERLKSEFTAGKDDDLLNILADMEASLNKAKYLLKEFDSVPAETEEPEGEEEEKPEATEIEVEVTKKKVPYNRVAEALRRRLS